MFIQPWLAEALPQLATFRFRGNCVELTCRVLSRRNSRNNPLLMGYPHFEEGSRLDGCQPAKAWPVRCQIGIVTDPIISIGPTTRSLFSTGKNLISSMSLLLLLLRIAACSVVYENKRILPNVRRYRRRISLLCVISVYFILEQWKSLWLCLKFAFGIQSISRVKIFVPQNHMNKKEREKY